MSRPSRKNDISEVKLEVSYTVLRLFVAEPNPAATEHGRALYLNPPPIGLSDRASMGGLPWRVADCQVFSPPVASDSPLLKSTLSLLSYSTDRCARHDTGGATATLLKDEKSWFSPEFLVDAPATAFVGLVVNVGINKGKSSWYGYAIRALHEASGEPSNAEPSEAREGQKG